MKNIISYRENPNQLMLILLALTLVIITGASLLVISSSFAPLFIGAGIIGVSAVFTWLRKPVLALYFAIFAVFLPTSLIPPEIHSLINRAATVIAFGLWIVDLIANRKKVFLPTSTILMILFLTWAAISLGWEENLSEGSTVLQTYGVRLVLFLVLILNEIRTKKELDWLLNTIALSGFLLIAISLITISIEGYTIGTRLKILDVNENALGLSLLISTPAVFWWAMQPTKLPQFFKIFVAGIFFVGSIGLIGLSGSRGSAISFGCMVLTFLIWKPTRKWGLFGVFVVGIAMIATPFVFSTTITRFLGAPGETILGGRESLWPAGWELIKAHPVLGVGLGNSPFQVIPYLMNFRNYWVSQTYEVLHNPILVIWAETGIPGLLLYLSVLGSAIFSFFFQFYKSKKQGMTYLSSYFMLITAMVIGYMVSWIKGGGMESDFSYFLVLAFLLIPASLINSSLLKQNGP